MKRTRAAVMRGRVILATLAIAAIFLVPGFIERQRQPVYDGRRIGEWFDDLCLGGLPAANFPESAEIIGRAASAFSNMDSNALPFLTKKLQKQSAVMENLVTRGRTVPVIRGVFNRIPTPSVTRLYAAHALGAVGTNSVPAVSKLLEAHRTEQTPFVKEHILRALHLISGGGLPTPPTPNTWATEREKAILERVRASEPREPRSSAPISAKRH